MLSNLSKSNRGFVFEIPVYVDRLMKSGDEHAFLTIEIAHSKDFVQLTASAESAQLDFPMVTSDQRKYERKVKDFAAAEGLTIVENYGSDGSLFLDIEVEGTSQKVAAICSKMLRGVFGVSGSTDLIFQHVRLALDTAA